MDFGYLTEFWNAITAETADTVAWFQSLGNAVGGAVGSVVLAIFHPLMDIIFLLYYALIIFGNILSKLLLDWIIGSIFTKQNKSYVRKERPYRQANL